MMGCRYALTLREGKKSAIANDRNGQPRVASRDFGTSGTNRGAGNDNNVYVSRETKALAVDSEDISSPGYHT